MDSNFQSRSPDKADKDHSFRMSSSDKAKRKYRRRSVSGSASSSSDGSHKIERSPSPAFPREDPIRVSDVHPRFKNGERKLDMESGHSRYDKVGDSHRHPDKHSSRSSQAYHRDHDYNRYNKRDEGERSYHRSSGYGRDSRSATHSDRMRHGSEHDRSGEYLRKTDKYMNEKSAGEERRVTNKDREERKNHRDKDSTMDRATSGKRYMNSHMDDPETGERDRHKKDGGGRDDMRSYGKSLGDHKSDEIFTVEEGSRHGRHSNTTKESGASRQKETHKSIVKDLGGQKVDTIGKREHDGRESERHKEKFSRETVVKDKSTSSNRKSSVGEEQYMENESSLKKFKSFNTDKDKNNPNDGQSFSMPTVDAGGKPPRFKLPQEAVTQHAQPSFEAKFSHDFDAAKLAAMKAAELVNRNLTGGGYMSTDQKKKLLWGSKKSTPVEESGRWNVSLVPDQERQEKFKKLMGVKGDLKPEHKPDQAEKQEQLQLDLEKQYTAGLRRRDGRTVGLGL